MFSALRYAADFAVAATAYILSSGTNKAMPNLQHIDSITKVSQLVTRILAQNPGPFTLQGTNTYLVGGGKEKILIDCGDANVEAYITKLREALEDCEIVAIIITHWHPDHVGGVRNVIEKIIGNEVPVYKVKGASSETGNFTYVDDGYVVSILGTTLRFVATPGHTSDHASLWLEEEKSLFAGDCILGEGTTVFEDLHTYMNSLQKIKDCDPQVIYPGHGPLIENPMQKIDEYVSHRLQRENQILEFIRQKDSVSSMDITNSVYASSPLAVRLAALNNVQLHLSKLIKDGKIEKQGMLLYSAVKSKV